MAAWDNVQLPKPPDLRPPTVDFTPLGQLGQAYYQGQELQRQQALRNAFQGGMPTIAEGPNKGQPDWSAISSRLFQLGAYDQGLAVMKQGYGQDLLNRARDNADSFRRVEQTGEGYGGGGGTAQPTTAPAVQPVSAPPVVDTSVPDTDRVTPRQAAVANAPTQPTVQPQPTPTTSVQPQPVPQQVADYRPSPSQIAAAAVHVPPNADQVFRDNPGAYADLLTRRADAISAEIDAGKWAGYDLKGKEEDVKALRDRAAKIREQLQPTTEQRNIQENIPGRKVTQEEEAKEGAALYKGLQASSRASDSMRHNLDAMTAIFNDPNFYSGSMSDLNLKYKKMLVALGGNPNTALPQEALRKVISANILNQTDQLKAEATAMGGNSGRIFQQQIQLMSEAAQRPDATPAALRYLTELGRRLGQHSNELAALASRYKGGHLDNGFNEILRQYNEKHPIFSQAELNDMRLVAPPIFRDPAQVTAAGLPSGTPFKIVLPNGQTKIKYVP